MTHPAFGQPCYACHILPCDCTPTNHHHHNNNNHNNNAAITQWLRYTWQSDSTSYCLPTGSRLPHNPTLTRMEYSCRLFFLHHCCSSCLLFWYGRGGGACMVAWCMVLHYMVFALYGFCMHVSGHAAVFVAASACSTFPSYPTTTTTNNNNKTTKQKHHHQLQINYLLATVDMLIKMKRKQIRYEIRQRTRQQQQGAGGGGAGGGDTKKTK